jgi:hypothetical protein
MNGCGAKDRKAEGGDVPADAPRKSPRRKRWIPLILLFVGLLGFAFFVPRPSSEPVYEGKAASYWLDNINGPPVGRAWVDNIDTAPRGMAQTIKAFKAMGTNAVPFLSKALQRKPSRAGEFVDLLNLGRSSGLGRAAAIAIRKIDPGEAARLGLPGTLGVP